MAGAPVPHTHDDPNHHDETLPPRGMPVQPPQREPRPGDMVDRYRIEAEIGRGAMGVVYRAHAEHLGRDVAIKVVSGSFAGIQEAHARFLREARAAARTADHPGIAGVHDLGEVNGLPYLVMELVEGPTLEECLDAERFDMRGLVQRLVEAARAVHHAHTQGVLHRDLKPSNLLIAEDGSTRVTDFGLASLALTGADLTRLTVEGRAVGTPAFMPPEQARGEACDARADVYGLGATLFACLAGRAPIDSGPVPAMVNRVVDGHRVSLRQACPDLDADLVTVVERALQTAPDDRYPTAAAFADDLERWLAGTAIESPAVRAASPPMPRGVVWALAGGTVVAGLAWAAWWVWAQSGAHTAAMEAAVVARSEAESQVDRAQAFAAMAQRLATPLAVLEDHFHGVRRSEPGVEAALTAVETECRAVPTAEGAPWIAFARWLAAAGNTGVEALQSAVGAAGDDPQVVALLIRARAVAYMRALPFPGHTMSEKGVTSQPAPEREDTTQARKALEAAVELWRERRPAGGAGSGGTLEAFAEGAEALARRDVETAQRLLAPLADDPIVGKEAGLLQGYALQSAGRYHEAALAFEPLAERGWVIAIRMAAFTRTFDAVERLAAGEPADAAFERAEVLLRDWAAAEPGAAKPHMLIGTGWEIRAQYVGLATAAARAHLERAAQSYDAIVHGLRRPSALQVAYVRVHHLLAQSCVKLHGDLEEAQRHLQLAIDMGEETRRRGWHPEGLRRQLADALMQQAMMHHDLGQDPAPAARKARSVYLETVEESGDPGFMHGIAQSYDYEARHAMRTKQPALSLIRSAVQWFERAVAAAPGRWSYWSDLALALRRAAAVEGGLRRPLEGAASYGRAAECYAEMVARFPGVQPVPTWVMLGNIRVNRALSLEEGGGDGRPAFNEAIAGFHEAVERFPESAALQQWLGNAYIGRAECAFRRKDRAAAEADLHACIAACERAVELEPGLAPAVARTLQGARSLLQKLR